MSDIYGHLFGMPFARYDLSTQSWRTSLDTSLLDLPMSSLTLPKSGGMRSGQLFEHPMLEPATGEHDSSSLPTPHAGLGERGRDGVILNPKGQQDLQHAIAHLLPTPTVNDMGAGKDPEKWQEWTEKMRDSHKNGNGHDKSLEQEAISLLPTPTAQAAKHLLDDRGVGTLDDSNLWSVAGRLTPLLPTPRAQNGEERNMNIYARPLDQPQNLENALALLPTPVADNSRDLQQTGTDYSSLPNAVIALTGDSTPKPSTDGKTPLDDWHQHQLSLDEPTNPD